MSPEWHMGMVAFAAMITPGPNNFLVINVAVTRNVAATLMTMGSIVAGSMFMLVIAHAGLGPLLSASEGLRFALKVVGAAVLVWLGIAIIRTAWKTQAQEVSRVGALAVLGLQFVNPKGWALILAVAALDVPLARGVLLVGAISFACLGIWALAGAALGDLVLATRHRQVFAASMGALLVVSAPLVLI